MNEEQKRWSYQYSSNVGAKEFLRLGCAMGIWILLGVAISVALNRAGYSWSFDILGIFFIVMFIIPFVVHGSRPGYLFIRKILGNENLPEEPYPRSTTKALREHRPWWSYVPALWWILIDLLLLAAVLKWLSK